MKHLAKFLTLAVGFSLLGVTPAAGQLWFFPDYALPSSGGTPSTFIATSYARGLNDASGKTDGFAAFVGRATGQVSFAGGFGLITGFGDSEVTVGGVLGVDLIKDQASPVQLTLQGGVGWMDSGPATLWRFPIGLALKARGGDGPTQIIPWIMPRVNISRASIDGFGSSTETDFGVSTGLGVTSEGGFGVHAALDVLASDRAWWQFGIGVHYVLPGGN